MLRVAYRLFLDPTMAANANSGSYRKRGHRAAEGGQGMDDRWRESEHGGGFCVLYSQCTDRAGRQRPLSSSTLTLTEEELVRGERMKEERLRRAPPLVRAMR
ncbi:A-kinase anchor protein 6 [Lates japonicus]|uniref:A-kinase anchor protein 6 n=1 Tax=Lates japonicus TaxID=270547 RepID=A0AAD3QXS3_LATJO|nr:A-kinase anchor protein 6 [Lates japonicus]